MANTVAISQVGGALAGGGNNTGLSSGAGAAPGDVTGLTVNYAFVDPVSLQITISVSFMPPSGGTYAGVHLWLEIPDQSDGTITSMTVGSTAVGTGTLTGPWSPIDLGLRAAATPQPWIISLAWPNNPSLNPNQSVQCRLYAASYSAVVDNTLVRAGQSGATPSVAFTLVSAGSSAGTATLPGQTTVNCGSIICSVLSNQNVSGKLVTPFLGIMGDVPSNPPIGWGYRLYVSYGTADPTNPANLTPVTDVETVAGIIPPPTKSDGVSIQHSFAIATPSSVTNATIWAVPGLTVNGKFTPNAVIPGYTNSCPITFGSSTGVIDASQAMASSISTEISVILGKLGLTPSGVGAGFLAPGAAQTNLGVVSASTIIAASTITGSLLATTGIITTSAQIGTAVIADSNIGSLNVSKLLAGTASFTSTVTFQSSSGPSVAITSSGVSLTGGTYSVSISSSSGISISQSGGPSVSLTGSGLTLTAGSNTAAVTSSNIQLSVSGGPAISISSSGGIQLSTSGGLGATLTASLFSLAYGVHTVSIDNTGVIETQDTSGNSSVIGPGSMTLTSGATSIQYQSAVASTASAGSASLPAAPAGFLQTRINGTLFKLPYYNF